MNSDPVEMNIIQIVGTAKSDRGCGTRYEDSVANAAARSSAAVVRTAVLVMNSGSVPPLCPFFEKCDGTFLANSADGSKEFRPRDQSSAK